VSNLGLFGEGPGGLEDEGVEDEEGAERDPVVADDEAGVEHRILSKKTKISKRELSFAVLTQ